jgi:serine/threonine protein kinase
MLCKCLVNYSFLLWNLDTELGEIGEGGYAKVYLVERKSDKRMFALKKNSEKLKCKDNYFSNILKDHELSNVVKIYDVDDHCIIMELSDNGPLSDFINFQISKKLPIDESVFISRLFFMYIYLFVFI